MTVESLVDLVKSPYITGLLTFLVWVIAPVILSQVIGWWRSRPKATLLVVHQLLATSETWAPIHLPDRVTMEYGEERREAFWLTLLEIRNIGQDPISRPVLYLEVDDATAILGSEIRGEPEGEIKPLALNRLEVQFPYLNPFDQYKQHSFVTLFCDREPEPLTVNGGGEGWKLEWRSLGFQRQSLVRRLEWTRRVRIVSLLIAGTIWSVLSALALHTWRFYHIILFLPPIVFGVAHLLTRWWELDLEDVDVREGLR